MELEEAGKKVSFFERIYCNCRYNVIFSIGIIYIQVTMWYSNATEENKLRKESRAWASCGEVWYILIHRKSFYIYLKVQMEEYSYHRTTVMDYMCEYRNVSENVSKISKQLIIQINTNSFNKSTIMITKFESQRGRYLLTVLPVNIDGELES